MQSVYFYFSVERDRLFGVLLPENAPEDIRTQYRIGLDTIEGDSGTHTLSVEVSGPRSFVYDLADCLEMRGINGFHSHEQLEGW